MTSEMFKFTRTYMDLRKSLIWWCDNFLTNLDTNLKTFSIINWFGILVVRDSNLNGVFVTIAYLASKCSSPLWFKAIPLKSNSPFSWLSRITCESSLLESKFMSKSKKL
jgi:hypothetical protein